MSSYGHRRFCRRSGGTEHTRGIAGKSTSPSVTALAPNIPVPAVNSGPIRSAMGNRGRTADMETFGCRISISKYPDSSVNAIQRNHKGFSPDAAAGLQLHPLGTVRRVKSHPLQRRSLQGSPRAFFCIWVQIPRRRSTSSISSRVLASKRRSRGMSFFGCRGSTNSMSINACSRCSNKAATCCWVAYRGPSQDIASSIA